jgi:hypothetical protein
MLAIVSYFNYLSACTMFFLFCVAKTEILDFMNTHPSEMSMTWSTIKTKVMNEQRKRQATVSKAVQDHTV